MAICIFECDPSEKQYWQEQFPDQEVFCFHTPLESPDQAREIGGDVEVVCVFVHSQVTREVLQELPNLKYVLTRSTGYNHIDLAATAERGIAVSNVPSYGEHTVAEHAFALLLALSRRVVQGANQTHQANFSTDGLMGFDLHGKTMGVLGTGRIGKHTVRIAKGFGMRVVAFDKFPDANLAATGEVEYKELPDVLRESDVLSLHLNLTPETEHFLNREMLELCKPGVVIINTARGELIETAALIDLIQVGRIAAAGLDVVEGEDFLHEGEITPLLRKLIEMPQVLLTPHMAFDSKEALLRIRETSLENIRAYLAGQPTNLVKPA